MRIGIFVVTAGRHGGGPETYEVQLIRALARLDKTNEYFVYCTTESGPPAIAVQQANVHYRVLWPKARWISVPLSLPLQMMRDRVDFYHATMVPPPWSTKPFLMTILCSSNWVHPEFYPKRVVWRLNRLLEKSLFKATTLLCISNDLLGDVHRLWGVAQTRMRVTYMGVGEEFSRRDLTSARVLLRDKYGIAERYLLFIGQQQERKNVFRVIEAYGRYRARAMQEHVQEMPILLLVGRENDPTDPIAQAIDAQGLTPWVKRVRYVAFPDLPELYSAADALVFPSQWEGFGLPLVESMACGTPVITSTATCLPEIAGDAAILVIPESVDEIAEAIYEVQSRPEVRQRLIERGLERATLFTWESCARHTLEAYAAMRVPANRRVGAVAPRES